MREERYVIVGGGIVGMTLGLALQRYLKQPILILDAGTIQPWQTDAIEERVSALSLSSQKLLQAVGVWEAMLCKRTCPYREMLVWDAVGTGSIQFNQAEMNVPALGYIVEDAVTRSALHEAILQNPDIEMRRDVSLQALSLQDDVWHITCKDGRTLTTPMLFAADGAKSWVRDRLKIETKLRDYEHTAIVATLQTALPHQAVARQCFTELGPLAFLPLADPNRCSIVWSVSPENCAMLQALSDEAFAVKLQSYFYDHLGKITLLNTRSTFPLYGRHAEHYILPHLALVGDAAHTLHPLAGQGVNLGLLDVACLVSLLKTRGSNHSALRCYERTRKTDNTMMLNLVWGLKNLFANASLPLANLRSFGLRQINQCGFAKNELMRVALGQHMDLTVFE